MATVSQSTTPSAGAKQNRAPVSTATAEEKLTWQAEFPKGRPNPFVKALSLLVTVVGSAVMAGWIFDIGILKSISSGWVLRDPL
jgi:hypothetical protein